MKLNEINDNNLKCYLAGTITIDELKSKMIGCEPYSIIDNKVIATNRNEFLTTTLDMNSSYVSLKKNKLNLLSEGAEIPAKQFCIVTVCRKSDKYGAMQVRWLLNQLVEHIKKPFRFICLTDDMDSPGAIPFIHNYPRWWSKMEVFRPDLYYAGEKVMYIDLDAVFTKEFPVPEIPHFGDMIMVKFGPKWFTQLGSGLMIFSAPFTKPYEWFIKDSEKIMKSLPSDQECIMSSVIMNGGNIETSKDAEVQEQCGSDYIPVKCPKKSLFFTAGDGAKPWNISRSWIPQMKKQNTFVDDTALITVVFGSDPLRIQAARNGAKQLCNLPEKLSCSLLVELLTEGENTKIPEWTGERLAIKIGAEYQDIWQKEVLMNLGAYYVFEHYPDIEKLVFTDLDVYPSDDWKNDFLHMTSKALDKYEVVQPYYVVSEDSIEDNAYRSYIWQKKAGAKIIDSGQGFCIAMQKLFFVSMNGFPENALSGSGDSLTLLQIDKDCAMSDIYVKTWKEWRKNVENYKGPKTEIGWLPCELKHASHGKRDSKSDGYRCYQFRNYIWDFVNGVESVLEKDAMGLWKWKRTPLARATRNHQLRYKEFKTLEDVKRVWNECRRVEGLSV